MSAKTLQTSQHRIAAAVASAGLSYDPVYRAVLAALKSNGLRGRVLDYGAGAGVLSRALASVDGVDEVVAVDICKFGDHPDPANVRWHLGDLNEKLELPDQSFDCVAAVEVIEHLENPRQVAREIFRLLKPGGLALVSTPNNESWRSQLALLLRGHYVAFLDGSYPAHITALLRADLMRILTEAGFRDVQFLYTDYGSMPKLTRITWQQVSLGLLRGRRYSDNVLCVARRPSAS